MALPVRILERLAALCVQIGEVEERFVRGTGPGGQKLNKTSSTVWLRHRPSGIEVRCQRERSQSQNRELAWQELCDRIDEVRRREGRERQNRLESERRRNRQKTRAQKQRMIESKRRRAAVKSFRRKAGSTD